MKKAWNVNNIENAIIHWELMNDKKLNCNRFDLAICIVDYMNCES